MYLAIVTLNSARNWFHLVSFNIINITTGAMPSMICYYGIELVLSRKYLKSISKKFSMESIPDLYYISIRAKFFIFLIAISWTPLVITSQTFDMLNQNGRNLYRTLLTGRIYLSVLNYEDYTCL